MAAAAAVAVVVGMVLIGLHVPITGFDNPPTPPPPPHEMDHSRGFSIPQQIVVFISDLRDYSVVDT